MTLEFQKEHIRKKKINTPPKETKSEVGRDPKETKSERDLRAEKRNESKQFFEKVKVQKLEEDDRISNVVGSAEDKRNWKNLYKQILSVWPKKCRFMQESLNCMNAATVGAHIYIEQYGTDRQFIVPACTSCNVRDEYKYNGVNKTNWAYVGRCYVLELPGAHPNTRMSMTETTAGVENSEQETED
jgi:hypothetical protein